MVQEPSPGVVLRLTPVAWCSCSPELSSRLPARCDAANWVWGVVAGWPYWRGVHAGGAVGPAGRASRRRGWLSGGEGVQSPPQRVWRRLAGRMPGRASRSPETGKPSVRYSAKPAYPARPRGHALSGRSGSSREAEGEEPEAGRSGAEARREDEACPGMSPCQPAGRWGGRPDGRAVTGRLSHPRAARRATQRASFVRPERPKEASRWGAQSGRPLPNEHGAGQRPRQERELPGRRSANVCRLQVLRN